MIVVFFAWTKDKRQGLGAPGIYCGLRLSRSSWVRPSCSFVATLCFVLCAHGDVFLKGAVADACTTEFARRATMVPWHNITVAYATVSNRVVCNCLYEQHPYVLHVMLDQKIRIMNGNFSTGRAQIFIYPLYTPTRVSCAMCLAAERLLHLKERSQSSTTYII